MQRSCSEETQPSLFELMNALAAIGCMRAHRTSDGLSLASGFIDAHLPALRDYCEKYSDQLADAGRRELEAFGRTRN